MAGIPFQQKSLLSSNLWTLLGNTNFTLPRSQSDYIGGGSFIGASFNTLFTTPGVFYATVPDEDTYGYPINSNQFYGLYSPAYFKYPALLGVNFNNSARIVMRSDRLPTSTCIDVSPGNRTAYALQASACWYRASR